MRLVFLGTGEFGVPAMRALRGAGHEIVAAVSQPDRPARRGLKVRPTPIHQAADQLGLRHVQTEDVNQPNLVALFDGADAGVVVAFGQKLGPAILAATPRGCINIHASLLPRYRGAAPIQWAVINGDPVTGVTTFRLNERWDAGDILDSRETPIAETETADELHDRLAAMGAALIVQTLEGVQAGMLRPTKQDPSHASRAPKLSRADAWVDFAQSARRVTRRIHGLWSWPAATCLFRAADGRVERVQIARAQAIDDHSPTGDAVAPGAMREDGTVQCGSGRVRLLEVKPAGGKLMPFDAFARGRNVAPPARWDRLDEAAS
jgi:methionyl-tRNA formyltransferase